MIYCDYRVWKKDKGKQVLVLVSKISVGDQIAVLPENSKEPIFVPVVSIIPVFSPTLECFFPHKPRLIVTPNSEVLTLRGFQVPSKHASLVCAKELVTVAVVKKCLTAKKFYSIMLETALPVIIEDGYVLKM